MRGVYVASATMTITTSKTLMLLEVPSSRSVEIRKIHVTNTDLDTAEQLDIAVFRVSTKGSPAGTSVTPAKAESGDQASVVTATANLTTEPTAYEAVALSRIGVSNLLGYRWEPDAGLFTVPQSGLIGVKSMTTITSATLAVLVEFMEIG